MSFIAGVSLIGQENCSLGYKTKFSCEKSSLA